MSQSVLSAAVIVIALTLLGCDEAAFFTRSSGDPTLAGATDARVTAKQFTKGDCEALCPPECNKPDRYYLYYSDNTMKEVSKEVYNNTPISPKP